MVEKNLSSIIASNISSNNFDFSLKDINLNLNGKVSVNDFIIYNKEKDTVLYAKSFSASPTELVNYINNEKSSFKSLNLNGGFINANNFNSSVLLTSNQNGLEIVDNFKFVSIQNIGITDFDILIDQHGKKYNISNDEIKIENLLIKNSQIQFSVSDFKSKINAKEVVINKEPIKPVNKPKTVAISDNSQEKIKRIEEQILKRKNASSKKDKVVSSDKKALEKQKIKPRRVINKSSEDLAAYAIEPNLNNRKTYLKIGCDLVDVNVYLDGRRVGKTPLSKRLPVSAGWHRIRIDVPGAKKFNKSGIPNPDFRDVYVTKGRTQKVTFKFLNDQEEPG